MWKRLQNTSRATIALLAIIPVFVIFIAVMLIISLVFDEAQIDLTEGQVYTLSDSTRSVLENVEEPIHIKFFVSSELAQLNAGVRSISDRVLQLLQSYEQVSDGLVQFEQIDPVPYSREESDAIAYGLVSFNLNRAAEQGYIGLVGTNSLDQVEIIDAIATEREALLEYDLTRMIHRLARPTEPVIGVFDGAAMFGNRAQNRLPTYVIDRLGDDFQLELLAGNITRIPDNIDALLIAHPHHLTENALYAVDQFVIRGGPALVILDPLWTHGPVLPNNPTQPQFPDSYLEPLMAAWGVEMVPGKIVGDLDMAISVRSQGDPNAPAEIADNPTWMIVDGDNINADDIITTQLTLMRVESAGALRSLEGAATEITPLLSTTTESMLYDQSTVLRREAVTVLRGMFSPDQLQYVLAGRVNGAVTTAFPDGPPPVPEPGPDEERQPDPLELITESVEPINLVILTDADMMSDNLAIQGGSTQNADFIVNALDSLLGGNELINLRGRGLVFRPFTRLSEAEDEAEERFRDTEQELLAERQNLEAAIEEVRRPALSPDGEMGALTVQQRELMEEYNDRLVEVGIELRELRSQLRTDIEALENRMRLLNIAAVPLVVIVIGLGVYVWRRIRLSRYLRTRMAG